MLSSIGTETDGSGERPMGSTFDGVWRGANGELEMRNVTGGEREVTLGTVCMKVLIKPTGQIGSCQAKKPERTQRAQDASRPGGEGGGWKGCWGEADEVAKTCLPLT